MFNNSTPFTMPVTPAYGSGYGSGNGMFGGDGWWVIIILALLFGWGNNGWGGNGGSNGVNGFVPYAVGSSYTDAAIQRGFDNQAVISKLDGITQGICDSTYTLNNVASNGFANAELGAANRQAALMQQLFAMQASAQQCCCEQREAIGQVRYDMATQACDTRNTIQNATRDIIEGQNAGTRAILDFLTQDKISTLTAENQSLKFAASQSAQNAFITANQEAQTAELIRRIAPYPVPAYTVPAPFAYGYGYGCNSGCGC